MLGIALADDAGHALSLDDLAVLANRLDAGTNLHSLSGRLRTSCPIYQWPESHASGEFACLPTRPPGAPPAATPPFPACSPARGSAAGRPGCPPPGTGAGVRRTPGRSRLPGPPEPQSPPPRPGPCSPTAAPPPAPGPGPRRGRTREAGPGAEDSRPRAPWRRGRSRPGGPAPPPGPAPAAGPEGDRQRGSEAARSGGHARGLLLELAEGGGRIRRLEHRTSHHQVGRSGQRGVASPGNPNLVARGLAGPADAGDDHQAGIRKDIPDRRHLVG